MIDASSPKKCPTPGCALESLPKTFYECANGHRWWLPNPGPQTKFLSSTVHEILYGGAAGGGKSIALMLMPLRWAENPRFRGVIFRRETGQLEELINYSEQWFPHVFPGARKKKIGAGLLWRFPSGARLKLAHCKDVADAKAYNGQEIPFIGFDELTHFTLDQYLEIKGRCRTTAPGLPRYIRCTSNPGSAGHAWVFKRWGAWLDPDFEAPGLAPVKFRPKGSPPIKPGVTAWIVKGQDDLEYYVPNPKLQTEMVEVKNAKGALEKVLGCTINGTPLAAADALSRVFIPASLADNPVLMETNPAYKAVLADNDPVRRKQLEEGSWTVKPSAGLYFKRTWFVRMPLAQFPAPQIRVRYWDRAATPETQTTDPDWTVGLRGFMANGILYLDAREKYRGGPGENEKRITTAARNDGGSCYQALEQDPGSAGKFEVHHYMRALSGLPIMAVKPTGEKTVRAFPVSSAAQGGLVVVPAEAPWADDFFATLEAFPTEGHHDDDVDALSGLYFVASQLAGGTRKGSGGAGRSRHSDSRSSRVETHSINTGAL